MMDYRALLAHAGFLLRAARPGVPWLGAEVKEEGGRAVVAAYPLIGSPLYEAGIDRGAVTLELGGRAISGAADVAALLAAHRAGDRLSVAFEQRGVRQQKTLALTQHPALEVVPYEAAGRPVTDARRAFRAAWLGSKAHQ